MRLEACKLSCSDRDLSDQELSEYFLVTTSGILTPNIIRMYCVHLQEVAKGFPSPQWARLIECPTSVARVMCLLLCVWVFFCYHGMVHQPGRVCIGCGISLLHIVRCLEPLGLTVRAHCPSDHLGST